jgi:hypothetical protein
MEPKKAHTVKRPNSHNRASRRKRANYDQTIFVNVLVKRASYRGGRKSKRALMRLGNRAFVKHGSETAA